MAIDKAALKRESDAAFQRREDALEVLRNCLNAHYYASGGAPRKWIDKVSIARKQALGRYEEANEAFSKAFDRWHTAAHSEKRDETKPKAGNVIPFPKNGKRH